MPSVVPPTEVVFSDALLIVADWLMPLPEARLTARLPAIAPVTTKFPLPVVFRAMSPDAAVLLTPVVPVVKPPTVVKLISPLPLLLPEKVPTALFLVSVVPP